MGRGDLDVFFVYFLNGANGGIEEVVVFCGDDAMPTDPLFSETQREYFVAERVKVRATKEMMYKEDSVTALRRKIGKETLDNFYLFTESQQDVAFYWRDLFDAEHASQYIQAYGLHTKDDNVKTLDEWMDLLPSSLQTVFVPLGLKSPSPVILANPFAVQYQPKTGAAFRDGSEEAFLQYSTTSTNIYVCRQRAVQAHAREYDLDLSMYFPKLPSGDGNGVAAEILRKKVREQHSGKGLPFLARRQLEDVQCSWRLPHELPLSLEHIFKRFHVSADVPRVTWTMSVGEPLVRVYKPLIAAWSKPHHALPGLCFHFHHMTLTLDSHSILTCRMSRADHVADIRFPDSLWKQLKVASLDTLTLEPYLKSCAFTYSLTLPATHQFGANSAPDIPGCRVEKEDRILSFHEVPRLAYVPILDLYFDEALRNVALSTTFWTPPPMNKQKTKDPTAPPPTSPMLLVARSGGGGPMNFHFLEKITTSVATEGTTLDSLLGGDTHWKRETPRSFLATLAFYLGQSSETTVREMLCKAFTLDRFLKFHNGNLPALFRRRDEINPKEEDEEYDEEEEKQSTFASRLDFNDPHQVSLFHTAVSSYSAFKTYLQRDQTVDYTYLWDLISEANPDLFPQGLNLVLLRFEHGRAQVICPTNAYSSIPLEKDRQTAVVLKMDDGQYSPILTSDGRALLHTLPPHLVCLAPTTIPSLSWETYPVRSNMTAKELNNVLESLQYQVVSQVLSNKIVGLLVKTLDAQQQSLFVPCLPSAVLDAPPLPVVAMPAVFAAALPFEVTRIRLVGLSYASRGKVPCKPRYKVVQDGLRTGIVTEANDFVPTVASPPDDDDLETIAEPPFSRSKDDDLTSKNEQDDPLATAFRLESQFFHLYESLVRVQLREKVAVKTAWIRQLQSVTINYENKMNYLTAEITRLLKPHVHFQLFNAGTVKDVLRPCDNTNEPYCLTLDDGSVQTIFPKFNLVDPVVDNETMYAVRLADELIRVRKLQARLLYAADEVSAADFTAADYVVAADEVVVPMSALAASSSSSSSSSVWDTAVPQQQQQSPVEVMDAVEFVQACLDGGETTIRGFWGGVFPAKTRQIKFRPDCQWAPLLWLTNQYTASPMTQSALQSMMNKAYAAYFDPEKEEHRDRELLLELLGGVRQYEDRGPEIHDVDWWVLCQSMRIPAFLFWSPKGWLRLYAEADEITRYFFIYKKKKHAYHIVTTTLPLSALNTTGLQDEQGRLVIPQIK